MGECANGHDCPSAPGGFCCGMWKYDDKDLMTLVDAAEILIDNLHVCDIEAVGIADRISGQRGKRSSLPDGVQVLEDGEALIRASLKYLTQ